MAASHFAKELQAIQSMLEALEPLDPDGRQFAVKTVLDRLNLTAPVTGNAGASSGSTGTSGATGTTGGTTGGPEVSNPRQFLIAKRPQVDIERAACLAYLLKHHLKTTAFKTRDLTKMNREAAGRELSNATVITGNALRAGYFAKAGGGKKQISALGELVVEALPDQSAVKAVLADHKPRRKARKRVKAKSK